MVNIMTIKSLKKFTVLFNRNEGGSLIPIVMIMVVMALMGGVFTSIMGVWKQSAPVTINSKRASYLAETAATYALKDASYRFFSVDADSTPPGKPLYPSATTGTKSAPFFVVNNGTETAQYWIERPYRSFNTSVDEYPSGVHRGDNDDDGVDDDDDGVDDDDDDGSKDSKDPDMKRRYTIIATGKVIKDGITVAKRQVKVKAIISDNSVAELKPGVHTDGHICGTGSNQNHFDIDNPTTGANVTYDIDCDTPTSGSEDDLIYRPSKQLDANMFKAMAQDQGHYIDIVGSWTVPDDYPNGSYYYTGNVPNFIFVEGDVSLIGNRTIYGVYWIAGNTDTDFSGGCQLNGIFICHGDINMNGGGAASPNLNGGIISYGDLNNLTGSGSPVDIEINEDFFSALNSAMTIVTVESWQESVSAN
jgi:hypothetical protein